MRLSRSPLWSAAGVERPPSPQPRRHVVITRPCGLPVPCNWIRKVRYPCFTLPTHLAALSSSCRPVTLLARWVLPSTLPAFISETISASHSSDNLTSQFYSLGHLRPQPLPLGTCTSPESYAGDSSTQSCESLSDQFYTGHSHSQVALSGILDNLSNIIERPQQTPNT